MSDFSTCEETVRRFDPDRYFSALFAPADKRPFLHALYALNVELARVAESVREPMLAEIRLAWWRETVEGARKGQPRNHAVARALTETLAATDLPQALFDRMIEARSFDASPEVFGDLAALEAYADATSGNVMRLAARILGAAADDLAREAGIAFALAGLLRSAAFHSARGKRFMLDALASEAAQIARSHLAAARTMAMPRDTFPAFLPAALVPLYLKRNDPSLWRRQLVFLRAATRGRL